MVLVATARQARRREENEIRAQLRRDRSLLDRPHPFASQVLGDYGGDTDAIVASLIWLALFIDPLGRRVARRRHSR